MGVASRSVVLLVILVGIVSAVLVTSSRRAAQRAVPEPERPVRNSVSRPFARTGPVREVGQGSTVLPATIWQEMPLSRGRPPGFGTVTCQIDSSAGVPGMTWGTVMPSGGESSLGVLVRGSVVAEVPAGSGTANYSFQGATGVFSWSDLPEGGAVACSRVNALWRTGLHGNAVGAPLPRSFVSGCGGQVALEGSDGGAFYFEVDAPVDCDVRINAYDDHGVAAGSPVQLQTEVGQDSVVTLHYPTSSHYRRFTEDEVREQRELDWKIAEIKAAGVKGRPAGEEEEAGSESASTEVQSSE